jgi:hypothetical protein
MDLLTNLVYLKREALVDAAEELLLVGRLHVEVRLALNCQLGQGNVPGNLEQCTKTLHIMTKT